MLYSQNVKNLVSGVSQQPPILRLPEQLAEQLNGFSTESNGLQKRPPTVHIKTLMSHIADSAEPLVHFVNRDETERYIMYFYNNGLRIFDLDGNEKTVTIQEDSSYLQTSHPRKDIRVVTVADYTFIVNRTKKVTMTNAKSPNAFATQGCLVHVKSGQYGRTYEILSSSGTVLASYTTPDGSDSSHVTSITTTNIVTQLATALVAAGYTVDTGSSWLRVQNVSNLSCKDGYNNQAMIAVNNAVQDFSDLPYAAPSGYVVEVKGSPDDSNAGNYYVQYDGTKKVWEECVCPNLEITLDASTMPHTLIRNANGSFTFKRAEWEDRKVGDEDSNPLPSFVGKKLGDIFFYRNRLGVLADENVVLTQSGSFFDWWMTTANDLLDTDPIDVPTTTNRINILNYAVPFDQNLYIFSDSTQFILSSDTVLSPKNTSILEATGFNSSPDCRPVVAGHNLYFPAERAEYTSIKEYYNVQQVSDVKNALDISSHVPSYIPNGVYKMIGDNNENVLLLLTEGDESSIYVYKYLFLNEQRVQASWSKWDVGGHIFGIFFVGSTLYLSVNRGDKHVLEKLVFTYNTKDLLAEPYRVYMDCKKMVSSVTYDDINETTSINVANEYEITDTSNLKRVGIVLPDGVYEDLEVTNGVITFNGDHRNEDIVLGIPYLFKATLSPIYVRQTKQNGSVESMLNGRLQIRDLKINYDTTGGFVVHVEKYNHEYTYRMTSKDLGEYELAEMSWLTGVFRVPVQALNTAYTAWIESDLPVPLSIVGYLWRGNFIQKSRGV